MWTKLCIVIPLGIKWKLSQQNFQMSKCHSHSWIQNEKCIQTSKNKPGKGYIGGGGVLRFELDRGVPLEPQNPYPSLRVILAKKGTHF